MIRLLIKAVIFFIGAALLAGLLIGANNTLISKYSASRTYTSANKVPEVSLAVVPGAGDSLNNLYFKGRVDAAARLFRAGKIRRIMVIGLDDGGVYREPRNMKQALELLDVPGSVIDADTNGRRTFRAVAYVAQTHAGERVLFISQRAHLERILFIARCIGLDAAGFAADESLPYQYPGYHRLREYFARLRCTWDCICWKLFPEKRPRYEEP